MFTFKGNKIASPPPPIPSLIPKMSLFALFFDSFCLSMNAPPFFSFFVYLFYDFSHFLCSFLRFICLFCQNTRPFVNYSLCPTILWSMLFLPLLFVPFATFCASSNGWSLYEMPFQIGQPSPNGMYEFELTVEPTLSMSVAHEHNDLSVHDYDPGRMVWTEREKSQLRPCLDQRDLLAVSSSVPHWRQKNRSSTLRELALHAERSMPALVQWNGRHGRLSAVNGQSPGPTLVVKDGTEVLIRLKNRLLLESLTIHFHGQTMNNSWFHDGVAPMQQCPVAVRSDFEFRFTAQSAGTHFYRGQFPAGHQSNGLVGAFIVLPKDDGQKEGQRQSQKDFVAILQDLPLVPSWEREVQMEEGSAEFVRGMHGDFDGEKTAKGAEGDGVWAILINSKGWHSRDDIRRRPHRLPWTTFRVDKGDEMRFRLIHAGFQHPLVVHIELHQMEVIATDGSDVTPFPTDALIIFPGERFDVRVRALRHPRRPIHRMVVGLAEQFLAQTDDPIYGLANLDYHSIGETSDPDGGERVDFLLNRCSARQCVLLGCPFRAANGTFTASDGRKFMCRSVDELRNNGKSSNDYYYPSEQGNDDTASESHHIWLDSDQKTVDGFRFRMPAAVGPFSARNGAIAEALRKGNCSNCGTKSDATPCECFYHKRFQQDKTIEITFVNNNSRVNFGTTNAFRRSLSVHLHGIRFQVLKIAVPELLANGTMLISLLGKADTKNERNGRPAAKAWKDSVMVPYGGHAVIRFYAHNTGWWLAETQQNGRGTTNFAFAIGEDDKMLKAPEQLPSDCNIFDPGTDIYTKF